MCLLHESSVNVKRGVLERDRTVWKVCRFSSKHDVFLSQYPPTRRSPKGGRTVRYRLGKYIRRRSLEDGVMVWAEQPHNLLRTTQQVLRCTIPAGTEVLVCGSVIQTPTLRVDGLAPQVTVRGATLRAVTWSTLRAVTKR